MTLHDFLRNKAQAEELCIVCNPWRVAAFWIDHEDLFLRYIDKDLARKEVIKDEWHALPIRSDNGSGITILAHHIYVE